MNKPIATVNERREVWTSSGASGRRIRCRILVAGYLMSVHGLLILLLCDPGLVYRARAFVWNSPQYRKDYSGIVAGHQQLTQLLPADSVVLLGDSRMRDLDARTVADGLAFNLSIGGDTTSGLLSRLPRYHQLDRCRLVVLGVGINDLSHFNDEEILHNYDQILSLLETAGARRVAVCSVFPVDEAVYQQSNAAWILGYRTTNTRIAAFNQQLHDLCGRRSGVQFIDTTAEMADQSGNLRPGYAYDGLHLTELGNQAWAKAIRRELRTKSDS